MKAWLKGGLIGGVIGIMGVIISLIILYSIKTQAIYSEMNVISVLILIIFTTISIRLAYSGVFGCNFSSQACNPEAILGYIITIALFFGIGTLIGWIVDKVKQKN